MARKQKTIQVRIKCRDDHYWIERYDLSHQHYKLKPREIPLSMFERWQRHSLRDAIWREKLRQLEVDQYVDDSKARYAEEQARKRLDPSAKPKEG